MVHILAYDIGTTGVKTCLFEIGEKIKMIGSESEQYGLYTYAGGEAEQHAEEWWEAMVKSTRRLLYGIQSTVCDGAPGAFKIDAISFCSQMQGLVLVDENGVPVRHPMSYMDQRAKEQFHKGIGSGVKIAGLNVRKLLRSLKLTSAVSGSVKDPMWKYLWIKDNEPEAFSKARWWLDVKEYLIGRLTGEFVMTEDSAYATLLYQTRNGRRGWSKELCRMFGIDAAHLPRVIHSTDEAGKLRAEQAQELGIAPGIPVFGGGGDAALIGIGAGCVNSGDTHIYWGTSGWVSTIVDKQVVDTTAMIGSIIGAQNGKYNYFAEMETAGKSLEWVKDHLVLDEVGVYLKDKKQTEDGWEGIYESLYDYMSTVIEKAPAGAGGVLFTPWLHGNRCPFEDPNAAGMFFNIKLNTGKKEMLRAVIEGICYHLRWMLECQDQKVKTSRTLKFCGGGALSSVTAQILADITGRVVEVVESPQNTGSVGAAITAAVGLKELDSIDHAAELIPVKLTCSPCSGNADIYNRNYEVFKRLHKQNKNNFQMLNGGIAGPEDKADDFEGTSADTEIKAADPEDKLAGSEVRTSAPELQEEDQTTEKDHETLKDDRGETNGPGKQAAPAGDQNKKTKKEVLRAVKFGLFSASAGIIEILIFTLMEVFTHFTYWPCYLVALICSVIWNFTLNRHFTFQSANNVPVAMMKIAAFYCVFTPVTTIGGNYLAETLLWNAYLVTGINMACNLISEYLYDRFFVFGKSIDTNKRAKRIEEKEHAAGK